MKKKVIILVIIIVLFVVAFFGGFFVGKKYELDYLNSGKQYEEERKKMIGTWNYLYNAKNVEEQVSQYREEYLKEGIKSTSVNYDTKTLEIDNSFNIIYTTITRNYKCNLETEKCEVESESKVEKKGSITDLSNNYLYKTEISNGKERNIREFGRLVYVDYNTLNYFVAGRPNDPVVFIR